MEGNTEKTPFLLIVFSHVPSSAWLEHPPVGQKKGKLEQTEPEIHRRKIRNRLDMGLHIVMGKLSGMEEIVFSILFFPFFRPFFVLLRGFDEALSQSIRDLLLPRIN